MTTRRRWLQFSLRGFFVVVTIGCLWLGVAVNRAREEAEAVKRIEAVYGVVEYNWEPPRMSLQTPILIQWVKCTANVQNFNRHSLRHALPASIQLVGGRSSRPHGLRKSWMSGFPESTAAVPLCGMIANDASAAEGRSVPAVDLGQLVIRLGC